MLETGTLTAIIAGEAAVRGARYDANDPAIRRKREELYAGLVNTAELMAIMMKSKRSIARLIAHGMPHTQLFGENLFDLEAVKAWVTGQAKASRRPAPRGRGRPRIYEKPAAVERRRESGASPTAPPP
jgi:hypothetical protein